MYRSSAKLSVCGFILCTLTYAILTMQTMYDLLAVMFYLYYSLTVACFLAENFSMHKNA